jgi:sialic acid synthase SpsE
VRLERKYGHLLECFQILKTYATIFGVQMNYSDNMVTLRIDSVALALTAVTIEAPQLGT